jgi:hypothetical protein
MPLFTSGRVRLLDNKKLISQFASLERRTGPLGKDRVDHGPNGHDDVANAAALAVITRRKPKMHITEGMMESIRARGPYDSRRYQPRVFF